MPPRSSSRFWLQVSDSGERKSPEAQSEPRARTEPPAGRQAWWQNRALQGDHQGNSFSPLGIFHDSARRTATLVVFAREMEAILTDAALVMFDKILGGVYRRFCELSR
jgi:hypothetical protein